MATLACFKLRNKAVNVVSQLFERVERELVYAPADTVVQQLVFLIRQHHQVLWSVIKTTPIAVMNMLIRCQWASKDLLHHESMFWNTLPVYGMHPIAVANRACLVWSAQIDGIEQLLRTVPGTNRVHVTERPQLAVVTSALTWLFRAAWNVAMRRERCAIGDSRSCVSHGLYFNMKEAS